jgi:hypothetical protein
LERPGLALLLALVRFRDRAARTPVDGCSIACASPARSCRFVVPALDAGRDPRLECAHGVRVVVFDPASIADDDVASLSADAHHTLASSLLRISRRRAARSRARLARRARRGLTNSPATNGPQCASLGWIRRSILAITHPLPRRSTPGRGGPGRTAHPGRPPTPVPGSDAGAAAAPTPGPSPGARATR